MKTHIDRFIYSTQLEKLLSQVNVKKILLSPKCQMSDGYVGDEFYVIWEYRDDVIEEQEETLQTNLNITKMVSEDERYYTLKNQRQRELFLLSEYDRTKTEAQDIIELLKPEMAAIFSQEKRED